MVIQRKILNNIKDHLYNKYRLDMNGGDIRLAFALYTAYQNDVLAVTDLRKQAKDAYEVFGKEEPQSVGFSAYERSIYRALEEITPSSEASRAKVFERLLAEVSE